MKKTYSLLLLVLVFCTGAFAQPTVLGTQLVNGSYTTYNLNTIGLFKQYRLQASSSAAISTRNWEFASGTAGATNYAINWRPYTAGNTLSSNIFIPTSFANGAKYNTAFGGASGLLPVITSGNYYTFNVNINAAADNQMELLETNYNPVTITSVSNTTPASPSNAVLITCTTSAAPSSGEYVYVRYSTDGYTTSTIAQFTFTGTTGQALIPCRAGGTAVSYYVMSSNQIAATITADAVTYGQSAYDMATLNLNNNSGPNYTYTQGGASVTNFEGIYSVPSTCYATVSALVTALNLGTVTAPVTMYAIAGSPTETATAGGISITQTGTVANPIVVQKFGTGAYTIQASAALNPGDLNDGIIKLIGADYITIDGLTLQENVANTTTAAATNNMTEFGIALLRASTIDGPQNNTIQSNTISLDRSYTNTFGIYSNSRASATAVATTADITSITGSSFGNKIYGNTVSNVNYGVVFSGSGIAGQLDDGNDIGGSSLSTGNTFTNWGSAGTAASAYPSLTNSNYCIFVNQQTNDNISYNTITAGAAIHTTTNTYGGILKNNTLAQPTGTITTTISNNTITLTSSSASGSMTVIQNAGLTTLSTATVNITDNTIVNCAITGAGTSNAFTGIITTSAPGTLNINNNIIRGTSSTSTSGGFTGISNSGDVVTTININNNQIGNSVGGAITFSAATTGLITCIFNSGGVATTTVNLNSNSIEGISAVSSGQLTGIINKGNAGVAVNINNNNLGSVSADFVNYSAATAGALYGFYNAGLATTTTSSISNNDIRRIVYAVNASALHNYITDSFPGASRNINNNTFTNMIVRTSGTIYFIHILGNMTATGVENCNYNSIITAFSKTVSGGTVYFYRNIEISNNGSTTSNIGNDFSNVITTGNSSIICWQNFDGDYTNGPSKTITGNIFSNISCGGFFFSGLILSFSGNNSTVSSNTISNISVSGNGPITGIRYGIGIQGTHSVSSNSISNLTSTGTGGDVIGIQIGQAGYLTIPTLNINLNSITGLSTPGAANVVIGLQIRDGAIINVNNNIINTISGSGGTSPLATGIKVEAGTTVNIGYNKIHTISETGAISATSPAVTGISVIGGTTVTTHNNFIANLLAPNANLTDAIRGIDISSTTLLSNYNFYYNSIYINASSFGADFGTSGIYHLTNATATTAALNLIDNIIVNTSTPAGTGITAAYRRSDPTLTNFLNTSDYNLFYAGVPGASNLIYYDGINSDQTLAAYKARVAARDANSISSLPIFTSATDLHLTPANCNIDNKGTPIGGFTDDIDADTRSTTIPDIGADEFDAFNAGVLAGVVSTAVCSNKAVVNTGTIYTDASCNLIARVLPSGGNPVAGLINTCVTMDASQLFFNGDPYVQRHYDVEPAVSNQTTTSATITMYFTDNEFALYNTNNSATWPLLPTIGNGGMASPFLGNVRVTQFHGTPTGGLPTSTPGNYTGTRVLFATPVVALNGTIWSVTVSVTGFSGFYVHTNPWNAALPIVVNYLTGRRQGSNHLLNWKVTCASTPRATMTLERSSDSRNYTGINTITADAARCNSPFDHTDANPLKGMNYYRLKIVDADGKVTYSTTVALLHAVKGFDIISIAPNPVVTDNFKLNIASALAGKMDISIFDMQGRLVISQTTSLIAGFNSLPVQADRLSAGTYTLRCSVADEQFKIIRFVKQ